MSAVSIPGSHPTYKPEYLVAGLGNPGIRFENTRHNVGFDFITAAESRYGFKADKMRFKSLYGRALIGDKTVLFQKPETYMNLSGEAVWAIARFYQIPTEHIIVISDDTTLAPGELRVRRSGSDGGHKGLRSIITVGNSENFPRIRIGIGQKPHPDMDMADWVLGKFDPEDRKLVDSAIAKAADAFELILEGRLNEAMNLVNRKTRPAGVDDDLPADADKQK